jgi:hypothetical protein
VPNTNYFLQMAYSVAGIGLTIIQQRIEDVNTFAGQTVTFSFYAKVNSGTKALTPRMVQVFGSGGSGTVVTELTAQTLTTTWQRFTVTTTVPSISGKTIGTSSYLRVDLIADTSETFTYSFANWQVEAGSVATAFQTATGTLQGELAACQRYYQRITATGVFGAMADGGANATTSAVLLYTAPVVFRTTPSTIESANLEAAEWSGTGRAFTALAVQSNTSNPQVVALSATGGTGYTTDRAMYLRGANNAEGFLGLGAEL